MLKIFQNKKIVALTLFGLLVTVASATFIYSQNAKSNLGENSPEVLAAEKQAEFGPPPEDLKTLNMLLLGYGGPGHQGGYLTDVLQLVHIDFEKSQIALISLPRDLWVELPNGQAAKINQALTLGNDKNNLVFSGGQVSKQMAATITGMRIDYFAAIDFVGFKRAIGNNLGGIEVEVTETLDDPWYPVAGKELDTCGMTPEEVAKVSAQYSGFELERQFPCRYEHLLFKPGIVTMQGGDALKFVRSRHGSSAGDFSRSSRQHAVLAGIKNRLFSLNAIEKGPEFFEAVSTHITTDLDIEAVKYLAPAIQSSKNFEVSTVIISTDNVLTSSKNSSGQSILIPKSGANNWTGIQSYLLQEIEKSN